MKSSFGGQVIWYLHTISHAYICSTYHCTILDWEWIDFNSPFWYFLLYNTSRIKLCLFSSHQQMPLQTFSVPQPLQALLNSFAAWDNCLLQNYAFPLADKDPVMPVTKTISHLYGSMKDKISLQWTSTLKTAFIFKFFFVSGFSGIDGVVFILGIAIKEAPNI